MARSSELSSHSQAHASATRGNPMLPPPGDLMRVGSRRWFLQTGLTGVAVYASTGAAPFIYTLF